MSLGFLGLGLLPRAAWLAVLGVLVVLVERQCTIVGLERRVKALEHSLDAEQAAAAAVREACAAQAQAVERFVEQASRVQELVRAEASKAARQRDQALAALAEAQAQKPALIAASPDCPASAALAVVRRGLP